MVRCRIAVSFLVALLSADRLTEIAHDLRNRIHHRERLPVGFLPTTRVRGVSIHMVVSFDIVQPTRLAAESGPERETSAAQQLCPLSWGTTDTPNASMPCPHVTQLRHWSLPK